MKANDSIRERIRPLPLGHFPSRLHAYVWRNWQVALLDRLATAVNAGTDDIRAMGERMGLGKPPDVPETQARRGYITVIRRNWDLMPLEQIRAVLGWTAERLEFTLREDARLWVKLGPKPDCAPLRFQPPDDDSLARERAVAETVRRHFPRGPATMGDPLYGFVDSMCAIPTATSNPAGANVFDPRFCYSYFAPFGDPFIDTDLNPYPDGLLARLAEAGVNGVWTQGLLYKLTPFPWRSELSAHWEERLENLECLTERAARFGMGVHLFFNEPRGMPEAFFEDRPELLGVVSKGYGSLCTALPEVREYVRAGVERVCRAAPRLTGMFTVSAEENLTHCWAWFGGDGCPRCRERMPEEVIAENARLFSEGIAAAGTEAKLTVWDWGWPDAWTPGIIARLPETAALMCVSESGKRIERGGTAATVNEYALSAIGPGETALARWEMARTRGLKTVAKVQAGNTWELASVPHVPVLENVVRHAANLREARVDGLMLSWTLGACPSVNMEAFAAMGAPGEVCTESVLDRLARTRFGPDLGPVVQEAWRGFSAAYREYPFDIDVFYSCPVHIGPANLLWPEATGRPATMVCFPYDDLEGWRSFYPPEVLIAQFRKVSAGFAETVAKARTAAHMVSATARDRMAFNEEMRMGEVCAILTGSVADQAEFILLRDGEAGDAEPVFDRLDALVERERAAALRLHSIQTQDARIGFEAGNHYFFVPMDLAEKILNCEYLLNEWLPQLRRQTLPRP